MVADGEGASRFAHYTVTGAADDGEARTAVRAIGEDILVRCALHGSDPNWGRMLARAGTCGVALDPERIAVWVGPAQLVAGGVEVAGARGEARAPRSRGDEVAIRIDLGRGRRARRAVRLLALARVRDVQRGVHDVTPRSSSSSAATRRSTACRVVARDRRATRASASCTAAGRRSARWRASAASSRTSWAAGASPTSRCWRACARASRPSRPSSAPRSRRRACARSPLGDGAVDVRRVPELGLVGEPVVGDAPARSVDALAAGSVPVVAPLGARRATARS